MLWFQRPNMGSGKYRIKVIVIGLILVVVLAGGSLYVWASQSSVILEAKESTGTFKDSHTMSGKLFFEDDEYYWDFEYKVIDDLLFLAPYDA